ncbi:MAG: hypothetical protein VW338_09135 [Rhodospirillaceae bacterium]|jgi:quercetin dioxygenase-like cupin family protein
MTEQSYRATAASNGYGDPMEKSLAPDTYNAHHVHDVALYLYILEGEMSLDIDGPEGLKETTCRPGETVEVLKDVLHTERAGPQGCRFLVARR